MGYYYVIRTISQPCFTPESYTIKEEVEKEVTKKVDERRTDVKIAKRRGLLNEHGSFVITSPSNLRERI